MAFKTYTTSLPAWKFWAKMNRPLVDGSGAPAGALKGSMTKTVTLFDESGNKLVRTRAKLGMGFNQELLDKDGNSMGVLRQKPVKERGILQGATKLWVIEKDKDTHIFMQPRSFKDVSHRLIKTDIRLEGAGRTVWEIVKGSKAIGTIVSKMGFTEEHDLVLDEGVSEEDRLLCLIMFGFKLHNFLK